MKVLQLCNKPPYPPVDGGTLAMNSITQGLLSAGCEVRVLSMWSDKHPVKGDRMTEEYMEKTRFEAVYVDLGIRILEALFCLLCGESYHVQRFKSQEFAARLKEILEGETFDVVHVESIFLTHYVPLIRKYSNAKIVLRAHNVEHHIWKQMVRGVKNPFKRWYLKHCALALGVYEQSHVNDYDAVACITEEDKRFFRENGCRKPIIDLPFGITPEPLEHVEVEECSLFHIGSMDWMPNEEGVRWFLEKVWPRVHKELPQVRLYLAGRKMPQDLMNLDIEGVSIIGEVPDAMYFIGSKQINIVPLLSGSGIRVKIIEAMSAGKTVITTSVGARGIRYRDGEDLLIADTPEEFVEQIRRCVEDQDFCSQVGRNAYNLIVKDYDNEKLTQRLLELYNR